MNKYFYHFFIFFLFGAFPLCSQDLYDLDKVQDIKITIDDPIWDKKLNAYKKQGLEKRILGKISINGISYDSVGIRYKGNSSFFNTKKAGSTKLPLNVKINHLIKGQSLPGGYKTLKLSNVFRDPSFLRESLSYEIARNYMAAPKANYARVYVNDTYLGLYNSTESVDGKFLKENFGDDNGVLIKCDPAWKAKPVTDCPNNEKATLKYLGANVDCYKNSYELKTDHGWEELVAFTNTLTHKPKNIEQVLNVDATLWMLAFDNILVNLDSYLGRLCHNYYMYQDTMGRFNPVIWDMNMSFGGFRFDGTGKSLSDTELKRLSPLLHFKTKNEDRPLIVQLLNTPLYRKIYLAHIRTILNDYFIDGTYKKRAKAIQQSIDRQVRADKNKLYSYEGFPQNLEKTTLAGTSKIIGLTELMDARTIYLKSHPLINRTAPTISDVKHTVLDGSIYVTAKIKDATAVFLFYRNTNNIFQKATMTDTGAHFDGVEKDGEFGFTIEELPNTEYYIVAENKDAAMLSPEEAAFKFYSVK